MDSPESPAQWASITTGVGSSVENTDSRGMIRWIASIVVAFTTAVAPPKAMARTGLNDLVRIDVLDGGPTADGRHLAGLRIELALGWKTYWRIPGETGIPPLFDFGESGNVRSVDITWPKPQVFTESGMTSIGYEDGVVLPIYVVPRDTISPLRLQGNVDLGICRNICIPVTVEFAGVLASESDRSPDIAAALAQTPWSADEAGVRTAECALESTAKGARLTVRLALPNAGGTESVMIESGESDLWIPYPHAKRTGGELIASTMLMPDGNGTVALDRSRVLITVLGQDRVVEIHGCDASWIRHKDLR